MAAVQIAGEEVGLDLVFFASELLGLREPRGAVLGFEAGELGQVAS